MHVRKESELAETDIEENNNNITLSFDSAEFAHSSVNYDADYLDIVSEQLAPSKNYFQLPNSDCENLEGIADLTNLIDDRVDSSNNFYQLLSPHQQNANQLDSRTNNLQSVSSRNQAVSFEKDLHEMYKVPGGQTEQVLT